MNVAVNRGGGTPTMGSVVGVGLRGWCLTNHHNPFNLSLSNFNSFKFTGLYLCENFS